MEIIFVHLWCFVNTLFFFRSYQIMGLQSNFFLVWSVFYVLDAAYRIAPQALGISRSEYNFGCRIMSQKAKRKSQSVKVYRKISISSLEALPIVLRK